MTAITWIGSGAMGARMAGRLLAAGHRLTVWNRTPGRAQPLVEGGARLAATPTEAVRGADVVFMMLADPAAVGDVVDGPEGVAAGLSGGATVIDMSTVGPAAVMRVAGLLPEGAALVDAPVLGSLSEAETGSLTLLVGGPDQVVTRLEPLLSQLGEPVHVGPLGSGATAKLVANFALLGTVGLLGEDLAVAEALGLPREVTWRVLGLTPLAAQAARRRPALEKDDFPARFALAMARKDADLVVEAAEAVGVDVRFARAVRSWLRDAEAAGLGGADYTAMLAHIGAARHATRAPTGNENWA
ncbi:NAD(P)-dependent oxidoreductase [Asanoa iriomotensis]|uniref:Tartronate semialdehyde reductase n=1 Tax=Asanoa iriomotensis TaxID=234613 RepID=A0ABQ4C3W2_9ACTN|nr:NAD(P)-dependent oxidoreductase [Asanoa iriomotensis]GIF57463.1 tartronate semialdehyde reductase [Asanoa iriomotensis]